MKRPHIRIALQDRAYLIPALRGLVEPRGFDVTFQSLPKDWEYVDRDDIDAGETSFARHVLSVGLGDDRLIGLPAWVMRSFRHRCMIVAQNSPFEQASDLAGATIGLTGWPDTGHTWSRAVLREAGADLSGINWIVGGLTKDDVSADRLGPAEIPSNVSIFTGENGLLDALESGELDAVFTPFMPPDFHTPSSRVRHLYTDFPTAEAAYAQRVGYVPGVHLVTLKRQIAEAHPWLSAALTDFLDESKKMWMSQRIKLADTTPWELREVDSELRSLGADWMPFGFENNSNKKMTADFCEEIYAQRVCPNPIDAEAVFEDFDRLSEATQG